MDSHDIGAKESRLVAWLYHDIGDQVRKLEHGSQRFHATACWCGFKKSFVWDGLQDPHVIASRVHVWTLGCMISVIRKFCLVFSVIVKVWQTRVGCKKSYVWDALSRYIVFKVSRGRVWPPVKLSCVKIWHDLCVSTWFSLVRWQAQHAAAGSSWV